ncbi:MAG: hypothetical protein WCX61_05785, partial [Candidatus Peribacteraceae bacterium]
YEGDPLVLEDDSLGVLKKLLPQASSVTFPNALSDIIDLRSFPGGTVSYFSIKQDKPRGYTVGVNLQDGVVSINQNWETWDHPENDCQTPECYEQYALQLSDLPDDETLYAIADAFLREHGVDVSHYGSPILNDYWRRQNARATLPEEQIIPGAAEVIYPLLIDGESVYEQHGVPAGISVSINMQQKAVSDIWNLGTQNFERSSYPAVTDADAILLYIKAFGQRFSMEPPPGRTAETVTIVMGTPLHGFTRMYRMVGDHQEELLVPALIFPVTSMENAPVYFDRQNIVVPLVAEFLVNQDMPVPLLEKQ